MKAVSAAAALAVLVSLPGCAVRIGTSHEASSAPKVAHAIPGVSAESYGTYGAPVMAQQALPLADVLTNVKYYEKKPLIVHARVKDVCKTMGCWMTLEAEGDPIRVHFTESAECSDGFYVPRNAEGRDVFLKGWLEVKDIPEDEARHYLEDGGASDEEINAVVGPQREVKFIAEGVMLEGLATLEEPAG